jgi:hypothetical protein
LDQTGKLTVLANRFDVQPIFSPNDLLSDDWGGTDANVLRITTRSGI